MYVITTSLRKVEGLTCAINQGEVQELFACFFEFKISRTSNSTASLSILEDPADQLSRVRITIIQQLVFGQFITALYLADYNWQMKKLRGKNKHITRNVLSGAVREQFAIPHKEHGAGKKRRTVGGEAFVADRSGKVGGRSRVVESETVVAKEKNTGKQKTGNPTAILSTAPAYNIV